MKKKVVYIDMDDTLCDFSAASYHDLKNEPGIKWPQSQFDFFRKLKPVDGAIDAFHKLEQYYFVLFLSKPSVNNLLCYTDKAVWIRDNIGEGYIDRLVLSCHKQLSKGAYLIDDFGEEWSQEHTQTGEKFDGEVINFRSSKFPNWESVLMYLLPDYYDIESIECGYENDDGRHSNVSVCFRMSDEKSGISWDNMGLNEKGQMVDWDQGAIVAWEALKEYPDMIFYDFNWVSDNGYSYGIATFKCGNQLDEPEEIFNRVKKGKLG